MPAELTTPKPSCAVPDCVRAGLGHGLCRSHWNRQQMYGDPGAGSTVKRVRRWEGDPYVEYLRPPKPTRWRRLPPIVASPPHVPTSYSPAFTRREILDARGY